MATLAAGDTVQVQVISDYQGQTIINTFHYKVDSMAEGADYTAALGALNASIGGQIAIDPGGWKTRVVDSYTFREVRSQKIWPTREFYVPLALDIDGTNVEDGVPSNSTLVVTLRVDVAAKGKSGSKHFTGFPKIDMTANEWEQPRLDDMDNLMTEMHELATPAPAAEYTMIVFDQTNHTQANIIDFKSEPQVRTMNRRTKGYGI